MHLPELSGQGHWLKHSSSVRQDSHYAAPSVKVLTRNRKTFLICSALPSFLSLNSSSIKRDIQSFVAFLSEASIRNKAAHEGRRKGLGLTSSQPRAPSEAVVHPEAVRFALVLAWRGLLLLRFSSSPHLLTAKL